uniref:WAP domain-containing protein n=1 Tax=Trichuris muris TaxID=70415 RepID=A0A5S6QZ67_TRIMR
MEFVVLSVLLSMPLLAWTGLCPDGALPIIDCLTNECPGGYQCDQGSCCRVVTTPPATRTPSQDSPSSAPEKLRQRIDDSAFEKPGKCPPLAQRTATTPAVSECQSDSQCQGDWKCCPTASGKFCIAVGSSKAATKHRSAELVMCIVDEECEPPSKCVNSRRGRVCATPAQNVQVCPRNEEFAQCASSCQTGCARKEPYLGCQDTYCRPGCICRSGFIRLHHNDWKSKCIQLAKCMEILGINAPRTGDVHVPESRALGVRCETSLHCSNGHVCHGGTCVPGWHETKHPDGCSESKRKVGSAQDECSSDSDCPKGAECRQSSQGRQCIFAGVDATLGGTVGETALCPDGRPPSSRCVMNECAPNYACWRGICCPLGDAKVINQSSRCPPIRSFFNGRIHFCDTDADCFSNENCCPTATGRQCMNTQITSPSVAAAWHHCPDGSRSVQVCYSDLECANGKSCKNGLCCPQKTDTFGQCPEMVYQPTDAMPRDHCNSDAECLDSRRKCCPTLLGKRCLFHTGITETSPSEEHLCFDGSRPISACRLDVCPSGYSCEAGYCCRRRRSYDAGRHNSRCPSLSFMKNLISFPSCISNNDCVNGTICCPALSGSKCVHPENGARYRDSSDTCDAGSKPLGRIPLRCDDDSNCPNGTKCCMFKGLKVCAG